MEKNHKRQYRELDDDTKQRISQSLKHKSKSETHRNNISIGMTEYWKTVENRPSKDQSSPTETGEII